jgi:hypothetical protein
LFALHSHESEIAMLKRFAPNRSKATWARQEKESKIGALGVVDARATFEDRHFPRSEAEAELVARDRFFEGND